MEKVDGVEVVRYKRVKTFDNYTVGTDGSIWRNRRKLKPIATDSGLRVTLSIDGKLHYRYLHRIMAYVFADITVGRVKFIDGNKYNCRLDNLVYFGCSLDPDGVGKYKAYKSPIKKADREYIKGSLSKEVGLTKKEKVQHIAGLAARFGVTKSAIRSIANND